MVEEEGTAKGKLLIEIASGLKDSPAYLLFFGVCCLFLLGGIGMGFKGINEKNNFMAAYGLVAFIFASLTSILIIKLVESGKSNNKCIHDQLLREKDNDEASGSEIENIMDSFPKELNVCLENANEVWLVGIHQSHILIRFYNLIRDKINNGDKFKVLLLQPFGDACSMTAMRFPGNVTADQERERIISSLRSFSELMEDHKDNVEIRIIDFLMAYGGFMFDPERSSGSVFIQRYTFRTQGGSRKPKFFHKNGNDWFQLYKTEINELWNLGVPWDKGNPLYETIMGRVDYELGPQPTMEKTID